MEDLLARNADELFPGFRVGGHGVFRVLRDSDIEIEEDAEDLVRYYRSAIQRRRRGQVIVLQLQGEIDPAAEDLLRNQLGLDRALVIKTGGLIGINGLSAIVDEDRPELKFDTVDQLVAAMNEDSAEARRILAAAGPGTALDRALAGIAA